MKLIPALLIVGMFAVSGCSKQDAKQKPLSGEVVKDAEAGNALAQCLLGLCYQIGTKGLTQDYKEAVKWYTKSAEQGNAMAQGLLGFCYLDGIGVAQDYKEAVKWLTMSAEQGYAQAKEALEKLKSK